MDISIRLFNLFQGQDILIQAPNRVPLGIASYTALEQEVKAGSVADLQAVGYIPVAIEVIQISLMLNALLDCDLFGVHCDALLSGQNQIVGVGLADVAQLAVTIITSAPNIAVPGGTFQMVPTAGDLPHIRSLAAILFIGRGLCHIHARLYRGLAQLTGIVVAPRMQDVLSTFSLNNSRTEVSPGGYIHHPVKILIFHFGHDLQQFSITADNHKLARAAIQIGTLSQLTVNVIASRPDPSVTVQNQYVLITGRRIAGNHMSVDGYYIIGQNVGDHSVLQIFRLILRDQSIGLLDVGT